jgi:hypothetical protein
MNTSIASQPEVSLLQLVQRFVLQTITLSGAMAAWLSIVVVSLAYLLPSGVIRLSDGSLIHGNSGVFSDFPLDMLLRVITLLFCVAAFPGTLVPMSEDERFTWFIHVALAWMTCLLGSVGWLWAMDFVQIADIKWSLDWRTFALLLAGVFLSAMPAAVVYAADPKRRLTALIVLLAGWLVTQGSVVLLLHLAQKSGEPSADPLLGRMLSAGGFKIGVLLVALLYIAVVMASVLPATAKQRRDVGGVLVLVWFVVVTLLLFAQLVDERITLFPGREIALANDWTVWILSSLTAERERITVSGVEFSCVVLTTFVAPFVSWLGMPWHEGRRGRVALAMFVATVVVLAVLNGLDVFRSGLGLLAHIARNYDGPHLLPDFAADWLAGR